MSHSLWYSICIYTSLWYVGYVGNIHIVSLPPPFHLSAYVYQNFFPISFKDTLTSHYPWSLFSIKWCLNLLYLNQDPHFDSSVHGCEKNNMNPQLDNQRDISNSTQQISNNFTITISDPPLRKNKGSCSSNSQNAHGENAKIIKKRKTCNKEDDKLVLFYLHTKLYIHNDFINWFKLLYRLLKELVNIHGNKWNFIAEKMSSVEEGKRFKGYQLWERYNYHLKPGILVIHFYI